MKQYGVSAIRFKRKSIKLSIMWKLFISMITAAVLTLAVFIGLFGSVQLISQNMYARLLKLCYANTASMLATGILVLSVYLICTIVIFTYRLNEITDHIKKISDNIHKLAQGDFGEKLPVVSNDELGELANDINIMSDQLDTYIRNEKQWNDERYNMITNISHDLKTPIMSISGYIQLIKDKRYADDSEYAAYCDIISKKSEELNNAINQLFELSKLNSSGLHLDKSVIRLKEFSEQIIVSYIPLLEERNMEIRIMIDPELYIEVDPVLMKRVFDNIILNAIKYADSGKYLDIQAVMQDNGVTVHFINYGPRILEQDLEHIFERYYREKKNIENEGNGLGLAIAKTIVQLHHGTISVTSDEDKTDFYLVL